MTLFRSFINAQGTLSAQARRAFSTALYGPNTTATKSCLNPELLYLQPRWHVQKDQPVQNSGKTLVGMIQKRWSSASAQPIRPVCFLLWFLDLGTEGGCKASTVVY